MMFSTMSPAVKSTRTSEELEADLSRMSQTDRALCEFDLLMLGIYYYEKSEQGEVVKRIDPKRVQFRDGEFTVKDADE